MLSHKRLAWTIAMLATVAGIGAVATPAAAQTIAASAGAPVVQLNTGRGRLIQLDTAMSDVFVANETVADVQVRSPTQLYVFGKGPGETTLSVVNKAGRVIYSATIRVGNNIDSIDSMLRLAMPEAEVTATPMNGLVLLTGTVASPGDAAEAERLVQAFVGDQTKIVSRLRTATPLQVMLQVRFAEVSRSFLKNVGVNLMTRDNGSGISFGVGSGTRTASRPAPSAFRSTLHAATSSIPAVSPTPSPRARIISRRSASPGGCWASTSCRQSTWANASARSPRWPRRT
jgi:pilus assembly protein CpaC